MGMIKSVNEVVQEKMNECADAGAQQFHDSIRPIYGSTEEGNPNHIGTCILLSIGQKKYLLTAAHIIEQNEHSSLYIGGKDKLVLVEGDFNCTNKPNGCRDKDHYDFAWLELSSTFSTRVGELRFISKESILQNQESTKGHLYLALGYPNSKNKKFDNRNKSIKPRLFKYSSIATEEPELCNELDISGNDHLFLDYNAKYSRDSNGFKTHSISPTGISGGALIDMGNISKPEQIKIDAQCNGLLVGMLIENHRKHNVMCAVKIGLIVNKIEKHGAF